MSERMIELHRARLLNSNGGAQPAANQNGPPAVAQAAPMPQPARPQLTPRQAAVAAMQTEDRHMKRFLQRLQVHRDDGRPTEALFNPTVPTALSRRILNRQGAGFLDPTVAAIGSAAADRFLATVLQQSITCRDQRLKGAELAKQAARDRKRHKRHYQQSVDDRRRRKEELQREREKFNLATIQAAEAVKQKTSVTATDNDDAASTASGNAKTKKKKKVTIMNGTGKRKREDFEDDEASYDSLDEEEGFYQQYENDDDPESESDEEEDEETVVLWDLARPLAAWDFHFDGKVGMDPYVDNESDDDNDKDSGEGVPPENGGMEDMDVDDGDLAGIEDSKPAAASNGAAASLGNDDKQA